MNLMLWPLRKSLKEDKISPKFFFFPVIFSKLTMVPWPCGLQSSVSRVQGAQPSPWARLAEVLLPSSAAPSTCCCCGDLCLKNRLASVTHFTGQWENDMALSPLLPTDPLTPCSPNNIYRRIWSLHQSKQSPVTERALGEGSEFCINLVTW